MDNGNFEGQNCCKIVIGLFISIFCNFYIVFFVNTMKKGEKMLYKVGCCKIFIDEN